MAHLKNIFEISVLWENKGGKRLPYPKTGIELSTGILRSDPRRSRVERWRGGVGFDILCFGVSPAVSQ
jgi:hypothetical protein